MSSSGNEFLISDLRTAAQKEYKESAKQLKSKFTQLRTSQHLKLSQNESMNLSALISHSQDRVHVNTLDYKIGAETDLKTIKSSSSRNGYRKYFVKILKMVLQEALSFFSHTCKHSYNNFTISCVQIQIEIILMHRGSLEYNTCLSKYVINKKFYLYLNKIIKLILVSLN